MNFMRLAPHSLATLMACLISGGLWQIGEGSWVYAKAGLAQYLLQRAWSRTLAKEANVKPWTWADTWPVARLTVPSLGIDQIVLEGAYGRTLAFGPGHVESQQPLEASPTIILTGHRDTHFSFLRRLKEHDQVQLETAQWSRQYRVEAIHIVDSRTASVKVHHETGHLVLVTCYPFDAIVPGGPLRYVVTASMVEDSGMAPNLHFLAAVSGSASLQR